MSVRVDQRRDPRPELDAYNKAIKLSSHVMSVAKPKEEKPNNHHIPKRMANIGKMMVDLTLDIGADILEANEGYYVGSNVPIKTLIKRYEDRVELEEHALKMTFRLEHIYRVLNDNHRLAESTNKYMMDLIDELRAVLTKWIRSEKTKATSLAKSVDSGVRVE